MIGRDLQAGRRPDLATGSGGRRAGAFVAYAFAATMVGTTLPSPLYPIYQQQLGFGSLLTTVVYAVYATGVLAVLLLFSRASDVLGRRPVLLAALAVSALSGLVFLLGDGIAMLFVGRVLSGFSAGLITATATAAIVESAGPGRRAGATMAATAVNMLGLGCGPLLAGLLADLAPAPLRLPYAVQLALLVPAVVLVIIGSSGVPGERPGALAEAVRPRLPVVPAATLVVFVPAAVAVFAAFAVFGLLTAIEPGILAELLHLTGHGLAGAVVFAMFAGSAISQVFSLRWPARTALPVGCAVLVLGLAGIAAAIAVPSLALLVAGTFVVGLGHGVSFRAGMTAITENSPDDRRAEMVAALNVVIYVGISVPVVLVGVATTAIGLHAAAVTFTVVVAVVALAAAAAVVRLNRTRP